MFNETARMDVAVFRPVEGRSEQILGYRGVVRIEIASGHFCGTTCREFGSLLKCSVEGFYTVDQIWRKKDVVVDLLVVLVERSVSLAVRVGLCFCFERAEHRPFQPVRKAPRHDILTLGAVRTQSVREILWDFVRAVDDN